MTGALHALRALRRNGNPDQRSLPLAGGIAALKARLGLGNPVWLLLTWDVVGMSAALVDRRQRDGKPLAEATSRQPRFAAALDEVLRELHKQSAARPRRVALAARHLLPAVLTGLPVQPDKARRPEQMRELLQADLEPALAEFGSLWSLGGLLQARGFLSAEAREQVTMEEAVRRQNRASQLRYGEIAMELGLIDRAALDECLDLQAALQNLDARLAAGWRGRIEDKRPLWLACGVGQSAWDDWREALAEHGLRLDAALPLAWLASTAAVAAGRGNEARLDAKRESHAVDIELHAEEVVAIHRRNGQVVAARSEGRSERQLSADGLHRLIADWTAEPRIDLRLYCLHAADDGLREELAENLALFGGHACSACDSPSVKETLWRNLLDEASAPVSRLPRVALAELRGNPLNDPDVRRLLVLGALVLVLVTVEGVQRYRLAQTESRIAEQQHSEKQRNSTSQLAAQANQKLVELAKELDKARRDLEPMLNERSRLSGIITMRRDLPELLYQLAQAVGSDAVIEEIHNDSTQSKAPAIQVIAWSPSYTGAQDFVNRMATLASAKSYGVSQMEIKERRGRDNRKGHEVKFWLLFEENELEGDETPPPSAAQPPVGKPPADGGGISSRAAPAPANTR